MTEKQKWLRKKLSQSERIGVIKRSQKFLNKELEWAQTLGGLSMHAHMVDSLNEMTLEELNEFKTQLNDFIKKRKEDCRQNAEVSFHNNVSVGNTVLFSFKGETAVGEVTKINDKSFTASFEWEGESVKKAIRFHLYLGNVVEAVEEKSEEVV